MTQDEVIKLAKKAGFGNYAYEAAGIFERFAAMVAAAEREKCTGAQEFVTLPREVVELAIEAIGDAKHKIEFDAIDALIAALKQPPTTEQSSAVERPQGEQEPVAWAEEIIEYLHAHYDTEMIKELDSGDALIRLDDAIAAVEEVEQRYTHPQPAQKPLTDDQVLKAVRHLYQSDLPVGMGFSDDLDVARAIEAAHNIK